MLQQKAERRIRGEEQDRKESETSCKAKTPEEPIKPLSHATQGLWTDPSGSFFSVFEVQFPNERLDGGKGNGLYPSFINHVSMLIVDNFDGFLSYTV